MPTEIFHIKKWSIIHDHAIVVHEYMVKRNRQRSKIKIKRSTTTERGLEFEGVNVATKVRTIGVLSAVKGKSWIGYP